jgi:hypothetical protein
VQAAFASIVALFSEPGRRPPDLSALQNEFSTSLYFRGSIVLPLTVEICQVLGELDQIVAELNFVPIGAGTRTRPAEEESARVPRIVNERPGASQ